MATNFEKCSLDCSDTLNAFSKGLLGDKGKCLFYYRSATFLALEIMKIDLNLVIYFWKGAIRNPNSDCSFF